MFDPVLSAVRWYFGELCHEALVDICIQALNHEFDGLNIRRIAGLIKPTSRDMTDTQIDRAFREMGVNAPIARTDCQLFLAVEESEEVLRGEQNAFHAATHIRIHICGLKPEPRELSSIVRLSKESEHAPRRKWSKLETELLRAFREFTQPSAKPNLQISQGAVVRNSGEL